mmetsp:Transcript_2945/g.5584  ORF Transcript_2945/g.5584 Transcript_2945/m.5584 type:complete len:261 (-) Transcript_2945:273-1055(-)
MIDEPKQHHSRFCLLRSNFSGKTLITALASNAVQRRSGYRAAHIHGKRYGELFGAMGLAKDGVDMAMMRGTSPLTPDVMKAGIVNLGDSYASLERNLAELLCRRWEAPQTANSSGTCASKQCLTQGMLTFTLDLHRNRNGELHVCEQVLIAQRHSTLGWPFVLAFQRDVDEEVPKSQLLQAAASDQLFHLVQSRAGAVQQWLLELSMDPSEAAAWFDQLVMQCWHSRGCATLVRELIPSSEDTNDSINSEGYTADDISIM